MADRVSEYAREMGVKPARVKRRLETVKERGPTVDTISATFGKVIAVDDIVGPYVPGTDKLRMHHATLHIERRKTKTGELVSHRMIGAVPEKLPSNNVSDQFYEILADMAGVRDVSNFGRITRYMNSGKDQAGNLKGLPANEAAATVKAGPNLEGEWQKIVKRSDEIKAANAQYRPAVQNSNTYANDLLTAADLPKLSGKANDGQEYWLPGADGQIAELKKVEPVKPAKPARSEYRTALTEVMSEAARGAVILNVGAPPVTPLPARIGLAVLGAAGWGGVEAGKVIYRGATGRSLVDTEELSAPERVGGTAVAAGVTGMTIAAGITSNIARSALVGGRVATAVAAGAVAAEAVKALDETLSNSEIGRRGAKYLEDMTTNAVDGIGRLKTSVLDAAGSAASAVRNTAVDATDRVLKAAGDIETEAKRRIQLTAIGDKPGLANDAARLAVNAAPRQTFAIARDAVLKYPETTAEALKVAGKSSAARAVEAFAIMKRLGTEAVDAVAELAELPGTKASKASVERLRRDAEGYRDERVLGVSETAAATAETSALPEPATAREREPVYQANLKRARNPKDTAYRTWNALVDKSNAGTLHPKVDRMYDRFATGFAANQERRAAASTATVPDLVAAQTRQFRERKAIERKNASRVRGDTEGRREAVREIRDLKASAPRPTNGSGDVEVQDYTRSDGTKVRGFKRKRAR